MGDKSLTIKVASQTECITQDNTASQSNTIENRI